MGVGLILVILGSALATRRPQAVEAIEAAPDPAAAALATVAEPATEAG
jgi:hypothetical protein